MMPAEPELADTAALDAWLAEHLWGWRPPGREPIDDDTDRIWTGYLDPDGKLATLPQLSTTGDGMLMVDAAVDEKHNGMLVLERSINHAFAVQYVCRECDEEYGWSMGPEAANAVARAAKSYVQGHAVTDKGCSFAGTAQAARAAREAEA